MCQHRTSVPRVETGIERYWREEREAELARVAAAMANALRPTPGQQWLPSHGGYLQGVGMSRPLGSWFGGIFGF